MLADILVTQHVSPLLFSNEDVLNQMVLRRNQLEHVVHVDNSIVCKRGFFMGNIFG